MNLLQGRALVEDVGGKCGDAIGKLDALERRTVAEEIATKVLDAFMKPYVLQRVASGKRLCSQLCAGGGDRDFLKRGAA